LRRSLIFAEDLEKNRAALRRRPSILAWEFAQFARIVKSTVILASVSTGCPPSR